MSGTGANLAKLSLYVASSLMKARRYKSIKYHKKFRSRARANHLTTPVS